MKIRYRTVILRSLADLGYSRAVPKIMSHRLDASESDEIIQCGISNVPYRIKQTNFIEENKTKQFF